MSLKLSPRVRWKIRRYREQWKERVESARGLFRGLWSRQRMCPACRALVDRKETTCPLCGEPLSRPRGSGLSPAFGSLMPGQASYTMGLLTANVALFLVEMAISMRQTGADFGAVGGLSSVDVRTLVRLGAKWGPLIEGGEWWRVVAPIFLHGGLLHIAMNSWVLYDLGPAVEGLYGRQKFLVLYVGAGMAGFVASYLWYPNTVSIGASASIFGLIGAMITYGYRHRRSVGDSVRNMYARWAIYGLLFGFLMPGLDNAAHLGGLAAGIAFGAAVSDMPSVTQGEIRFWQVLQAAAALLVLYSLVRAALWRPFF